MYMKKHTLKYTVSAFILAILLSGCLKDKEVDGGQLGIQADPSLRYMEIPGPVNGINQVNLDAGAAAVTFNVLIVRLAADKPAAQDMQVTLRFEPSLIAEYNTANGTNYSEPPASVYTIANNMVATIPAGSREGYLKMTMIPDDLIGHEYALGFSIASVSDAGVKISGNFSKQLVLLGVKNAYDGIYTLRGAFYHPSASPGYGKYTTTVELHTTGANSVNLFWPLLGGYAHPILSGTSFSYFLGQESGYFIDPSTKQVSVSNVSPTGTIVYSMGVGYNSRYDPATRTIYARFGYNYSPGGVFNAATTREWTDTLFYTGPR